MQVSLSSITHELLAITPNADPAERYAIIRQLFARRCWSGDRKELLNAEGKLNLQVSLPEVWEKLTRLEKIAALFQSRGFKDACALLPSLQRGSDEELTRRLSAYLAEVEALTCGVLTAPAISHYLALRTFLLADATAFTEMFQRSSHLINLSGISDQGTRRVRIKDLQEVLPIHLRTLCTLIDSACFSGCLEDTAKAKDLLLTCSDIIESCRQGLEKVRGQIEFKACFERMDRAWKCFQVLEKAFQDPLHLMPILLFPIKAQNVSSVDVKVENQDQVNLNETAVGWLNDSLIVSRKCTEALLMEIEKRRVQSRNVETGCKQALENQQKWNENIGKEVHALRELQLSREKGVQMPELLKRIHQCFENLNKLEQDYFGPLHQDVKKIVGTDFHERQLFHRPRRLHSLIAHGMVSSLKMRAQQILKVHQLLTGFCSPELQLRSTLFAPMDLLDLQVREALEQFGSEAVEGLEGEKRRKVEVCFSQITTTVSQFVDWMRGEWSVHDFAARSRAFDQVRLFRFLMKRQFAAINETAGAKPGMERLTSAVNLLAEMVLLDCWPQLLESCLSPATSQIERQTMFRLFSCSLRDFARDDLKKVCTQWEFPWLEGAPELKKKLQSQSEGIRQLLKELQSNVGPAPTLENFEACAGLWFAKLTHTIVRIQQREDKMLLALEDACEQHPELSARYDELSEKIKSARQIWERSCFSLNRGLLSDLLLRQLIEEEEKLKPAAAVEPIEGEEVIEDELEDPPLPQIAPVAVAPSVPRQMESVPVLFRKISERCRQLEQRHQGFVLPSKDSKAQFLHQFQGSAVSALIHASHFLRELIQTDKSNTLCEAEIQLRLAVMLEQASKLALSLKGIASESVLKAGRQGWRWQEHNPLHYCQALEKAGALSFTLNQNAVIKQLERVVEVSSRYPDSSRGLHKKPHKLLQIGLDSCLTILDSVCEKDVQDQQELPYALHQLAPLLESGNLPEETKEVDLLTGLLQRVKVLKLHRLIPQRRHVEGDVSKKQRMDTIDIALDNLPSILDIARDVLQREEDPALCLTLASSGLRQKAVALELAALIQLAHGAYPSPADPTQHFLFTAGEAPMKRYSHDLVQFAEMLNLPVKLQRLFAQMKPYLRDGYRYGGDKTLESFAMLSLLRDRLVHGQITADESTLLKNSLKTEDLEKQLEGINRCIFRKLREEVKAPLIEALKIVDEMLANYEEAIRRNV